MRITYSQIGAFIRIMVSIIHSDDGNAAEVSHVAGTAIVTLEKEVADDVLKSAVESKGYKVL